MAQSASVPLVSTGTWRSACNAVALVGIAAKFFMDQASKVELWPEALECIAHLGIAGYKVQDITITSTSSVGEMYHTKSIMLSFDCDEQGETFSSDFGLADTKARGGLTSEP